MSWVVCTRCHFSQMPGGQCRRCGAALSSPASASAPGPSPEAPSPPAPSRSRWIAAAAAAALVLVAALLLSRRGERPAPPGPTAAPSPTAASIDLSGKWRATVSKTLGGNPPRPVLKEISIESDRDGAIRAARVTFTDPGRGGAGAGYQTAPDGPRRVSEAAAALAAARTGASLTLDFLELPGWVPARPRLWKEIEGAAQGAGTSRYVLVESLETDYLIQAGITETGFLSYVFFSPDYAPARGEDQLSRVIHPEPGSSLRGFRDLLWDLSGAADFLKLELSVSVSGPEGGAPDHLVLKR